MSIDPREVLSELSVSANDFLQLAGNQQLLGFLNNATRMSELENVYFSDSVYKVNRRGSWQERHLVITNRHLYNFLPNKYSKCRREIELTQLYGIILSRSSDEMVFKVANEHDYRFRIVRRHEAVRATCRQFHLATHKTLKCIISDLADLSSMTTTKKDTLKGHSRAENLFCNASGRKSNPEGDDAKQDGDPANSSPSDGLRMISIPDRQSISSVRSSVNHGSNPNSMATPVLLRVLIQGWLSKRATSHKGWRRRYFRLVPPNLQYYEPRVKGCVMITDGVVRRFPRCSNDLSLESYFEDPVKLKKLLEFAKSCGQAETICFYNEVKRFQRLPARSAEQFNCGQAIYDRYLKDESTILLFTEVKEDISDAITLAQEMKVLLPTIFDDSIRQILSQMRSDLFPRFLSQMQRKQNSLAMESERADECASCLSKYSITKRRHTCGQCGSTLCGSCVSCDVSMKDGKGSHVSERVCDQCAFELDTKGTSSLFAFSYVSRARGRPLYLAASSQEEMLSWMECLERAMKSGAASSAVEQPRKEGWLKKKNPTNPSAWRARYFVLEGGRLWYYEMGYKGRITISRGVGVHQSGAVDRTLSRESSTFGGVCSHSNFSYRFIVSNSDRVYNMAAETEEDMLRWIDCLKKATQPHDASATITALSDDVAPNFSSSFFQEAPKGEVTLVFTDIQSSTILWERVPDAMNEALERHDAILREHMKNYNGYEVKTEGDAFMVAFVCAQEAVQWCLAVQKALLYCQWPDELLSLDAAGKELDENGRIIFCGIRVRMGMHTGFPNCRRNPVTSRMDYFGMVVNRSARVADSAHGGQIVCTEEVYNQLLDKCAEPVTMRELGSFPYKGISELVKVYEISSPELSTRRFPLLRTAATVPPTISRTYASSLLEVGDELMESFSAPAEEDEDLEEDKSESSEMPVVPNSPLPNPPVQPSDAGSLKPLRSITSESPTLRSLPPLFATYHQKSSNEMHIN